MDFGSKLIFWSNERKLKMFDNCFLHRGFSPVGRKMMDKSALAINLFEN